MTRVFFADRNLGKSFVQVLRAGGLTVEAHHDHFMPTAPDEQWLEVVGRKGWLAITQDRRIRYKPNEQAAVIAAGVGLFVLVGKAVQVDLARNFLRMAADIEAFVAGQPRPFIAKVHQPTPAEIAQDSAARGRVELWMSSVEARRRRRPRR